MLHELFIILSGHQSPLFTPVLPATFPLVSPSERALLNQIASLGNLHISLRQQCSQIVSTHPSTIARAVASGIDAYHLQKFRDHVVQVEASILKRDSGVVGGYDIVALARILSDFDGWDRILQYLDELATLMLDGLVAREDAIQEGGWMKGSKLINRLRADIHTGYPSLEEVALRLLQIAETTWLRQVSTWVLYGRLPTFGAEDFFVKEKEGDGERVGDSDVVLKDYIIDRTRLPEFVTPQVASSTLFIGRSLSHIRLRGGATHYTPVEQSPDNSKKTPSAVAALSVSAPELGLLPVHLSHLQSLRSPLSPQKFSTAISSIRLSLSKHTLQTLLPASKIVDILYVLREFFLLGRGEFAISLVAQADERVRNRWRQKGGSQSQNLVPSKPTSSLMKEGEVASVLTRTWGILSSFQNDDVLDERLDAAREQIYLTLHKVPANMNTPHQSAKKTKEVVSFNDILIGVPVSLNLHITWPMELFLTPLDVEKYDTIFAYMICSRRCLIKVQSLWHGRRQPLGPPGLVHDRAEAKRRRERLRRREQRERNIWATASLAVFFLEVMEGYWQGEVIEPGFRRLIRLLQPEKAKSKVNAKKRPRDDHESGHDEEEEDEDTMDIDHVPEQNNGQQQTSLRNGSPTAAAPQQDPETLTKAHHLFLNFLFRSLFLSDSIFPPTFRRFLTTCESLCAHIVRLEKLHSLEDLGVDHGEDNEDGGEEGREENSQISKEMGTLDRACKEVRKLLRKLVERLHGLDEERSSGKGGAGLAGLLMGGEEEDGSGGGGKIDRLLMRLNLDWLREGGEGEGATADLVPV